MKTETLLILFMLAIFFSGRVIFLCCFLRAGSAKGTSARNKAAAGADTEAHGEIEDLENKVPSCIGCGFCCVVSPCKLADDMYDLSAFYGGATAPCPALAWDGERHICANAERYREELNIAKGCPNSLNPWRRQKIRSRL